MAMASRKRHCKFTTELENEFPFIKRSRSNRTDQDHIVLCIKCRSEFSISSGGRNDITRHIKSTKHQNILKGSAISQQVSAFFKTSEFGVEEKKLAAAEALFAFHTVAHSHSFRSMDCTSNIIQKLYAKKFTCNRTKCEAIIKKVLCPYFVHTLCEELNSVSFISVYSDASNHKDVKMFPTLIRYFHDKFGIKVKILDFVSLPGETAELISQSLLEILEKNDLLKKIVGFCADNANTNFGGVARKGSKNIFKILNNHNHGVGCAAHIVHNALQTAADLLPVDVEHMVSKIYSHFYIYTVRVNTLKEFCDEAETEYHKVLNYCKTRWLALMPAIERILKLYEPLKSYFLSIDKCPKILENFFNNPTSEIWLKFIHSQSSLFEKTVKNIEGDKNTVMQVCQEIEILKLKCKERMDTEFIPLMIRKDLNTLSENGTIDKNWFIRQVKMFYANAYQYLDRWFEQFAGIGTFKWAELKTVIKYEDVAKTFEFISVNHSVNIANIIVENDLFDEVVCVKNYVSVAKVEEWEEKKIPSDLRWVEIFNHFSKEHISYTNICKIIQFVYCLPGTNAATERVFSLINKLWTKEKTQLKIETLKAMLIVKYNFDGCCDQFYNLISANVDLLKKIHSSEKYL